MRGTLGTVFMLYRSGDVGFEGDLLRMNYTTPELEGAEEHLNKISNASLKQVMLISNGDNWQQALETNEALNEALTRELAAGSISERASLSTIIPSPEKGEVRLTRWNEWVGAGYMDSIQQNLAAYSVELGLTNNAYDDFFSQVNRNFPSLDYERWEETPLFSNFMDSDSSGVQVL